MRRTLFTLAASVSAALFVAACVLWLRSHAAADVLWGDRTVAVPPAAGLDRRMFTVESAGGGVLLHAGRVVTADPATRAGPPTRGWVVQTKRYTRMPAGGAVRYCRHRWLGFGFDSSRSVSPLTTNQAVRLVIPYWFVAVCAATLPLAWVRRRLVVLPRLRAMRGECPACGYDLRATPERCPECGAVPEKNQPIST
jgi:hypothetical protein